MKLVFVPEIKLNLLFSICTTWVMINVQYTEKSKHTRSENSLHKKKIIIFLLFIIESSVFYSYFSLFLVLLLVFLKKKRKVSEIHMQMNLLDQIAVFRQFLNLCVMKISSSLISSEQYKPGPLNTWTNEL